jgi:peptidoglycan/LPS O-acetylase OafA/YrhL
MDRGLTSKIMFGGGFGVYLFFGLSGYLLFWPFARRHFGGGDPIDLRRYAINRAVRILPLYYVVVFVVLLAKHGEVTLGTWARFLTFTENFSPATVGKFVGPAWSLVIELQFYALLPLLAFGIAAVARGSRGRAAAFIAALGIASPAVRIATMYATDASDPLWRFNMPTTFLFFTSGMMLALLRLSWEERRPRWVRGPLASGDAWFLASLPLWALVVLVSYQLGPLIWPASFLVIGAVVLPLSEGPLTRSLRWRPLTVVGVASYSLYLWHLPVLEAMTNAGLRTTSLAALTAIGIPICIAVALLSYAIVESPFLRLRRQWSRSSAEVEQEGPPPPVLEPAVSPLGRSPVGSRPD